jgi:alpha-beta hydrolase superfamily lysophospholipase
MPVLILQGTNDAVIPVSGAETALHEAGNPSSHLNKNLVASNEAGRFLLDSLSSKMVQVRVLLALLAKQQD